MIPAGVQVYVAATPVDFRKGANGLMALVRDGGFDPFNGALYVFRSKRADRIKAVWWDGSGVCLFAKTLEETKFCWPKIAPARVRLGKVGFELQPLADFVLERIKQGERVFADETTLPMLAPGTGKTRKAWLWVYARDDRLFGGAGPPMVAYRFEEGRGGECAARHLAGFAGILQVDGYAAYNQLVKSAGANDGVQLAACFAHVRRKFYELHVNGSSRLATRTVKAMVGLWKIEAEIRGLDPAARASIRQERSAAIVAGLFELWEKELPRLSGKSKLAEAIRYAISRRAALDRFLTDGRIEIDSNIVERAIRPQTITRKNSLFAGSHGGGRTWATIATLLQTAKMNNVDPHAWLAQTLERIAQGWPISQIDGLMPWNFNA